MFRRFAPPVAAFWAVSALGAAFSPVAQAKDVPSPQSVLGFHPTDDRTFADWTQITGYFARLDAASDRVRVQTIGTTTLGKPLIAAFISAPENIRQLDKYKAINQKLADPRTVKSPAELDDLVKNGKTIVSISCSIHSTEIVASQMSMNLAYELATAKDPDTLEILNNTILLLIPSSNPDGINIVGNWYRKTLGTPAEGTSPPELYHPYAGHDDNRDWFMLSLKETQAITNFFWKQWFPEIVYDVHQKGSDGARFIIPPFYDPNNPRISPTILREVGVIGYKMAADCQNAGLEGVATNSTFDTWWHGGFRSTPYFHNSIGILSEAASADLMSPLQISRDRLARGRGVRGLEDALQPATNFPDVWNGGNWGPHDIAKLEMTSSRALLQLAAKFRPHYLRNFYDLGKANLAPNLVDPYAFVIDPTSAPRETVARFLEILMAQGMEVQRVDSPQDIALGPNVPSSRRVDVGSFLVLTAQPQRNNVLSLFEKQVYPTRLKPNGEAEAPYDVAGWTLPLQMGVETAAVPYLKGAPGSNADGLTLMTNINQARQSLGLPPQSQPFAKLTNPLKTAPRIGLYKGYTASMDEGWTRLVFDTYQIPYTSVADADVRGGKLPYDVIVLPAITSRSLVQGLSAERYPAQYAGGMTDSGVENLRKWVENGGKLVCFEESCNLAIDTFKLPMKDALDGLKSSEFYNPGSVVQLVVDTSNPLAAGEKAQTPAYFINSEAFEITDPTKVKSVATYASKDALLSGWMLGEKYLNGKTALAEASYGAGKILLFAFRPQHRGQTFATFPFVFNALEK